jgi:hypothetical protein
LWRLALSVLALAYEAGQFCPELEKSMKHDLLKECVSALAALRARMHEELDASVTAELDDVIFRLERCLESTSEEVLVEAELRTRVLEVIVRCLSIATNLAEIARHFFGPQ